MPTSPKYLSIFDLDKTLSKKNTSFAFGKWLYSRSLLSFSAMCGMVFDYVLHKVNFISFLTVHKRAKKKFLGAKNSTKELELLAKIFVEEHWDSLINPPILNCLIKADKESHFTLLLSAGPSFLVEEIAKKLPISKWHATEWDMQGNITVVDGEKKLELAKFYATKFAIKPTQITAYSDSFHDIPLLQFAGMAVVTQPDKKLKKLSLANNWEII